MLLSSFSHCIILLNNYVFSCFFLESKLQKCIHFFFIDNQEPIQISDSHENIFLENELVH